MDKYEVATLAEDYENKRARFQMLGIMNSQPAGTPERLQQSIDYHIAEAEMWEAYKALNSAKVR